MKNHHQTDHLIETDQKKRVPIETFMMNMNMSMGIMACEEASSYNNQKKKPVHFVLVHGISGGGWCWYKLRYQLEEAGYKVDCIDLKGSGIDLTDGNNILAFEDYNKPLLDFMDKGVDDGDQVVLVGHSAGGLSITQATHKFPKKVKMAVYVAATMLRLGFQTQQDITDGVPDLSEFGDVNEVYELGFGLGDDQPPTTALISRKFQREIAYQLSPPEDVSLAKMLLRPGPVGAIRSARFMQESYEFDQVECVYIKTKHDRVVKPHQQEAMITRWPPSRVYSLDSDHNPFFSAVSPLIGLLVKATSVVG